MNIKQAKIEITTAIRAYLQKNGDGEPLIPVVRQRPILLMGAPGIGKTAIMEQVSRECGIPLVAYSITHHTRQSAIGLPFISKREFGGKEYSVTEYTMSEIVSAVYEKIEATGIAEGILFIDEINCVSETLAPAMLQFLQAKTFGTHKIPDGWLIVAAGNPPEYNKSVRDFDVVTLDRVKKIDVEPHFETWKEYGYQAGIHSAILSYLEIRKNHFYHMETTIDGKRFVTARGWEDLSAMLQTYEVLGEVLTETTVVQYLQHPKIAKDFANYLDLYRKYKMQYPVAEILRGEIVETASLSGAPFDEIISVLGLLLGALTQECKEAYLWDLRVTKLHGALQELKSRVDSVYCQNTPWDTLLNGILGEVEVEFTQKSKGNLLQSAEKNAYQWTIARLSDMIQENKENNCKDISSAFATCKASFQKLVATRQETIDMCGGRLENAFAFLENTFGIGQELVVFVTELHMNFYAVWLLQEWESAAYHRYNQELLFGEKEGKLLQEIEGLQKMSLIYDNLM